jgi:tetratricopeptide (TPR) repeat protein
MRIPSVPTMLGRLYIADSQFDKAIALLLPFVNDEPDQVEAVAMLAEAYQATDRDAEAIALLEKSVQDAPELFSTLGQVYQDGRPLERRRARLCRRRGGAAAESAAALAVGDRAAERRRPAARPRCPRRRVRRATRGISARCICCPRAQRRTRDFAAAEVTARRLIALDSRALGGPRQLAQIFLDQDDHQKIVALLEPIVTARLGAADAADLSSDTFRGAYFDLASAYEKAAAVRQGDYDAEAGAHVVADRSARGDQAGALAAGSRQGSRRHQDAAGSGHQNFRKSRQSSCRWHPRSSASGKYSDAEGIFRQMIADDAKNPDPLNSLAYMLGRARTEAGRRSQPRAAGARDRIPATAAYLDTLGWAYYKQNRFDEAEAPAEEAVGKLPGVSVIRIILATCLNKRGSFEEAIAAWQKALDGDGDSISRSEIDDKDQVGTPETGRKK